MRADNKGTITAQEIIEAYQKEFDIPAGKIVFPSREHPFFGITDENYHPVDLDRLATLIVEDKTNKEKYVATDFDCDDFSFRLFGAIHSDRELAKQAFFLMWAGLPEDGHYIISFYDEGKIKILEPQTDGIFIVPAGWKLVAING